MKKTGIKQVLLLQVIIVLYTVSGVMAKFASAGETLEQVILYFGLDLFFLGVYALCWQQMIKIFPLSVAYANRAMALLWSALWAKLIFGEQITLKQLFAIGLVIMGTMIVNTEKQGGGRDE